MLTRRKAAERLAEYEVENDEERKRVEERREESRRGQKIQKFARTLEEATHRQNHHR